MPEHPSPKCGQIRNRHRQGAISPRTLQAARDRHPRFLAGHIHCPQRAIRPCHRRCTEESSSTAVLESGAARRPSGEPQSSTYGSVNDVPCLTFTVTPEHRRDPALPVAPVLDGQCDDRRRRWWLGPVPAANVAKSPDHLYSIKAAERRISRFAQYAAMPNTSGIFPRSVKHA